MTPEQVLERHAAVQALSWRVSGREVPLATKVGVPGAPGLDRGILALGEALTRGRARRSGAPLLDATGGPGALAAAARGEGGRARVLLSSAAARRAALAAGTPADDVVAGFAWDLAPRSVEEAWWRPATDRGRERLEAELAGWSRALAPGGVVWAAWHKDEGGKRAEARAAAAYFERVEVVERTGGWRVCALAGPREGAPGPEPWRRWAGPDGAMTSLVGTFAAGRLDAGSARLLAALEAPDAPGLAGARVLDLGCGSGALAVRARRRGAHRVHALDDDLAAVRSAEASLAAPDGHGDAEAGRGERHAGTERVAASDAGASADRVTWSDLTLDAQVASDHDLVLMNPPFHVGRQVVGALSQAFVAAALLALAPGGTLVLVANAALPYERDLAAWARWRELVPTPGSRFKVLAAQRG